MVKNKKKSLLLQVLNFSLVSKSRIYSISLSFMLISFAVFAALWFIFCNRYFVLYYHEQIQLFRFDWLYFRSYFNYPGGLSGYLGSFLTQFFYYPVAGSIILAIVLTTVVLLFYSFYRSCFNAEQLFFISFIPAVLLMMSFANINFYMSAAVGLLFALAGFRLYVSLSLPLVRYGAGLALFAVIYFIAGGNALLLTVMILIFENSKIQRLTSSNPSGFKDSWIQKKWNFGILLLPVLLPWLAWRMIYTVPISEAYFAQTPANFLFPTIASKAAWLSIPVLYLILRLFANKYNQWKLSLWKSLVANCIFIFAMTAIGAYSAYDRKADMLNRMAFDLQQDKFDSVIALGKAYPNSNRLAIYLNNIALAESGQMPYRMFQFRQIGSAGLFLDWQQTYFSTWYLGEIYYRLGIIPEAEHCAFESLVSSPREPNAQVLQRLVITNIVRRDSITADKYLRYFDRSFAYRKWARQQRINLALAMADTAFHLPGTPTPSRHSDFFMVYQQPDYTLTRLLEANPKHRLAFEYLMAYYMLQKNIEMVKWCMDKYYNNFDYPVLPAHFEEALMVYQNAVLAGDELFTQYPVSRATRDRFERYAQAFKAAQGNKRNFEQLKKQFGNTYWYYVHFIDPYSLQKKDEKNRY